MCLSHSVSRAHKYCILPVCLCWEINGHMWVLAPKLDTAYVNNQLQTMPQESPKANEFTITNSTWEISVALRSWWWLRVRWDLRHSVPCITPVQQKGEIDATQSFLLVFSILFATQSVLGVGTGQGYRQKEQRVEWSWEMMLFLTHLLLWALASTPMALRLPGAWSPTCPVGTFPLPPAFPPHCRGNMLERTGLSSPLFRKCFVLPTVIFWASLADGGHEQEWKALARVLPMRKRQGTGPRIRLTPGTSS